MTRLRTLLALLWRGHRRDALIAVGLLVALSLTEGVGLLSLLPALQAVGVPLAGASGVGALGQLVRDAFALIGVAPTLGPTLAVVVVVIAIRAAIQMAQARVAARLETRVVRALRVRIFTAVIDLPWGRFVGERPAALMQAVGPQVDDVHSALLLLLQIGAQGATVLSAVAVAAMLSPVITAIVSAAGAVLLLAARVLRLPGRRAGDALLDSSSRVQVRGTELLSAAKMVKAWGAESRAAGLFSDDVDAWARLSCQFATRRAGATFGLTVLSAVLLASLSAVALRGDLAPASVLLLLVIYARLLPKLTDLQHSMSYFAQVSSAVGAVHDLLARIEVPSLRAAEPPGERAIRPPHVQIRNATLRYEGSDTSVLRALSVECPGGQLTVVVGPSGAGKTTLGDLMLGLLSLDDGTVTLDGLPLGTALADGWRSRLSYLAQEPMLFHGTIRENLVFARPDATERDLRDALRDAACDFVDRLPQGLDAAVGDRGGLLSGGERQRLALARALLRQPLLLVLDEATSALDADTEARILTTLRALRGRCTVVFCTHREAVRAVADHIIELGAATR
jgi:ATP-binding cassette subfamily C protein